MSAVIRHDVVEMVITTCDQHFVKFSMFKNMIVPLILMASPVFSASAQEASFEAKCSVAASTNGGMKFATLKCHKVSEPGNYKIRTTVWESKDKKGYQDLSLMAGRQFSCTMVWGGSNSNRETNLTTYAIKECRR